MVWCEKCCHSETLWSTSRANKARALKAMVLDMFLLTVCLQMQQYLSRFFCHLCKTRRLFTASRSFETFGAAMLRAQGYHACAVWVGGT